MRITLVSFLVCCYYYYCIYITHASPNFLCLEDQQSLLLQFKNNLTFDPINSTKLKFWNNSTYCCDWSGVTCDNEGHVIALFLNEEHISGGFSNSSSLFSLQHLQVLYFSDNNFNSSIPSGFGKLDKLTILDLSSCHFYGTLSDSMSNLAHLAYLDLSDNDFSGAIPSSLFTLPSLKEIRLEYNQFSKLDEFFNVSSSILEILHLHGNYLAGPFPISIFQLKSLSQLKLSFNKFNGSIHLGKFLELKNLTFLDISYNNLFLIGNPINVQPSSFPAIRYLKLAYCNLKFIPSFLINQLTLEELDLSNNQIQGVLPNWIWKLQSLRYFNISHNFLTELEPPTQNLTSISIMSVDLHNNQIQGPIPTFLKYPYYLDCSMNKFSSLIPQDNDYNGSMTIFLSLSHNNLHGSIPNFLCNALNLQLLDLSFNNFSGSIPSCLMTMTQTLKVLNFRRNSLQGPIPDKFPASCALQTLNLNENLLHGPVPKSLAHCSELEVLDIGTNQIDGQFPCFLQNIPTLSVLVLRNNKFHGTLGCSKAKNPWQMIQIVDIAFNNFSGKLPNNYFRNLKKLKYVNDTVGPDYISFDYGVYYYQDSVTVMSKGQQMELVKILKIFTANDFSSNHFEGQIPEDLMDLKELYVLNFSNNVFSGKIPSTIGNLKRLESLDLSNNSLVGEIPVQLASLSFLSYLNLSFNHLVGKIPTGNQLQSFQATSFEGNYGLYGPPLTEIPNGKRPDELHPQPSCRRLASSIDWNFLSVELGFVSGLGIIIVSIMLWKKWRVRYWKVVDKILCWMFSRMYLEYATDRGQTYTVLRW
ncbi:receptor protein [Trifolium repens]|nr:receptor protein [Trifolium repens]